MWFDFFSLCLSAIYCGIFYHYFHVYNSSVLADCTPTFLPQSSYTRLLLPLTSHKAKVYLYFQLFTPSLIDSETLPTYVSLFLQLKIFQEGDLNTSLTLVNHIGSSLWTNSSVHFSLTIFVVFGQCPSYKKKSVVVWFASSIFGKNILYLINIKNIAHDNLSFIS